TLSGGQRQRIAIARAVIRDAPILVLDEPLAGLDSASADVVLEALERLIHGKTVVFITHELSVAQNADWMIRMAEGRIVGQGAPSEVLREGSPWGNTAETAVPRRARTVVGSESVAPEA